ncbi:MAG: galactose-1-phosphate uridylyltransferase [archaeon]
MELRKDYILDRWVIISEKRAERPKEYKHAEKDKEKVCYFCPGNENLTPPEIHRISEGGGWKIRVVPNKFPAVAREGQKEIRTDNTFFTFSDAYGTHEVIIETPVHDRQMADLTEAEIASIIRVYCHRITELSGSSKYVMVFKNEGAAAGTSLIHSHSQVVAMNIIPPLLRKEASASKKFDRCPFCTIIEPERNSERRCFENESFIAFSPYASRFNYEIWILPKKHIRSVREIMDPELLQLAAILKAILAKLRGINASYNFYLHNSPEGEDLHFHIEVTPRIANWAGFEFASEITINSVSPETAARFYRGEI